MELTHVVDSALPDADEPWNPGAKDNDPIDIMAAMVPGSYKNEDGKVISKGVWTAYVAADATTGLGDTFKLSTKDTISEVGGLTYRIKGAVEYMPGDLSVLFVATLVE